MILPPEAIANLQSVAERVFLNQPVVSVEFLVDYMRLNFDRAAINYYVWPIVETETIYEFSTPGYRDALCTLITREVKKIESSAEEFSFVFFDARLRCPIDWASRTIPEALEIGGKDVAGLVI